METVILNMKDLRHKDQAIQTLKDKFNLNFVAAHNLDAIWDALQEVTHSTQYVIVINYDAEPTDYGKKVLKLLQHLSQNKNIDLIS